MGGGEEGLVRPIVCTRGDIVFGARNWEVGRYVDRESLGMDVPLEFEGEVARACAVAEAGDVESSSTARRHGDAVGIGVDRLER
jgi:hypothetical protein